MTGFFFINCNYVRILSQEKEIVDRVKGSWLRNFLKSKVWLLGILVFVIAACGGGGGADAVTPTPADTSAADAAAATAAAEAAAAATAAAEAAAAAAAAKLAVPGLVVPKELDVVRVMEDI